MTKMLLILKMDHLVNNKPYKLYIIIYWEVVALNT